MNLTLTAGNKGTCDAKQLRFGSVGCCEYAVPQRGAKRHREERMIYWLEPLICMVVIVARHLDYNGLL